MNRCRLTRSAVQNGFWYVDNGTSVNDGIAYGNKAVIDDLFANYHVMYLKGESYTELTIDTIITDNEKLTLGNNLTILNVDDKPLNWMFVNGSSLDEESNIIIGVKGLLGQLFSDYHLIDEKTSTEYTIDYVISQDLTLALIDMVECHRLVEKTFFRS